MKKILLAFDGINFSEGAFEFVRKLNELQPVLLTGVFLPQAQLANLWSYASAAAGPFIPLVESSETNVIQQNIARFEKLCQYNNIDYRVHKDFFDFALPELKKESRYADLLVLGSEVFYENMGANEPNDFLKDVLHDVACPVLLVPEKFDFPESIILAYDGSERAVYAIKQFAYLFPELTDRRTMLVYVKEDAREDFPDKIPMEELATRHFSDLVFYKLGINPAKYFSGWIAEKKSALLVCGAYGRPGLSTFFKKSFVNDVIADHRLPVFIAHK